MKATKSVPDVASASALVLAAVNHGIAIDRRVVAAVYDSAGRMVAFLTHPDAATPSHDVARAKANTSAAFGASTAAFYEMVKDNAAVRDGIMARTDLALFGGGLPIKLNGELLGGIGVSGASSQEDELCAAFALKSVGYDQ